MTQHQAGDAFIADIAAASRSRLDLWIRLIDRIGVRQMAEIGVWKGAFAETMLTSCPSIERYFMVDPWRRLDRWNKPMNIEDAAFDEVHREALQRTNFAGARRVVLRGTTVDVIGEIPEAALDFVYIDGDHTLRGVTIDLVASCAKVKPGCYLGGDDFCPTIWQHSTRFEPTLAFPFAVHFAEAIGATIWCLPFNQFLIRKPREGERRFAVMDLTGHYGDTSLLRHISLRSLIRKSIAEMLPDAMRKALRRRR